MMLLVLIAAQAVAATDTIAGTVTGPGGRPLAGAIVQATSSVTRLSRWQTSDAGGRFTIQFPGRAPYELTAHYFGLVRARGVEPLWARQDRRAASMRLELAGIENPIDTILRAYGVLGLTGDQISRLRDVAASSDSVTLSVLERGRTVLTPSQWTRVSTERLAAPAAARSQATVPNVPARTLYAAVGTVYAPRESHAAGPDDHQPAREVAQRPDSNARLALRVGSVAQGIVLDGVLSEPVWTTVDSISNLAMLEPTEGGVPTGQTVVRVLVTPTEIVMGIRCYDPDPSAIVSFSKARDVELDEEDHIVLILDTFQDGRSGYVFAVNPDGSRFDGLVSAEGEDVNSNWDTIWEARTSRDASGWNAEIRIPMQSISFKKGLKSWGYNIERRIQRLQETDRWSGVSLDIEIYQVGRAGLLTNLPAFQTGRGLTIRPAAIGDWSRPEPAAQSEFAGDWTVDATQRIGNLTASATYNTDFAETEADARQVNLTRFDILFPEKRSFFLEGSDIFEFGLGLEEANLQPFYSRRIGLVSPEGDAEKIPILLGGKLNGRVRNTNLGALTVRTSELDSVAPATTMGVLRVKQNVFEESSLGALATFGDQLGNTDAFLAGVDFTYRTSRFLGDKRLLVGVWGFYNEAPGLVGEQAAYGFKVDYPADLFNFALTAATIGDAVDPPLGFVQRNDVSFLNAVISYDPRPSWGLVRQMNHTAALELYTDVNSPTWKTYAGTIKPFDWLFESGDRLGFEFLPEGDRPEEDFTIFETATDTVIIPAGSYQWTRGAVTGTLADKRKVSGELTYAFGRFYDGNLQTIEGTLALRPSPLFGVELGLERNRGDLPGGVFTQSLYSGRLEVKPSADFQVSSFLQYDNESRSFGTNTRLRWTFSSLGDLFVVYNHNLLRSLGTRERFGFESNQVLVKLVYALRY
jgi:Domain of unknown function (DUF5916)/Carboxypeptidase regulatory-like domain